MSETQTDTASEREVLNEYVKAVAHAVALVEQDPEFNVQRSFVAAYFIGRAQQRIMGAMLQKMRGAMQVQSGARSVIEVAIKQGVAGKRMMAQATEAVPAWLAGFNKDYATRVRGAVDAYCDQLGWVSRIIKPGGI